MIEAVKSTVANSALQRASVEQSSTLNSYAANPDKLQGVSQAAPYVSPTVRVDVNTKMAILEFRESVSGEIVAQIPSEQAIRTYKMREAKEEAKLLAKLTEKVGAQNGSAPMNQATTSAQAAPVAEASVQPVQDAQVSLANRLDAMTTQLVPVDA